MILIYAIGFNIRKLFLVIKLFNITTQANSIDVFFKDCLFHVCLREFPISFIFVKYFQYPTIQVIFFNLQAVEELIRLMQIFVTRHPDSTEQELKEIHKFKQDTIQLYTTSLDGRSCWATLIRYLFTEQENFDIQMFTQNGQLSPL